MDINSEQHGGSVDDGSIDFDRYRDAEGFIPDWLHELDRCSHWIEAALEHSGDTHSIGDIAEMVSTGALQLWPGLKAVIVTEIVHYPRMSAVNFFLAGGDLEELEVMEKVVTEWAKKIGCKRVTLHGRRGWDKTFLTKDRGWKPEWWVLAKEI